MRRLIPILLALFSCYPQMKAPSTDAFTAEQLEGNTALAHSLSGFMNAKADTVELDLVLAKSLDRALLHARNLDEDDWRRGAAWFFGRVDGARVPTETKLTVLLEPEAAWKERWENGDRLTGQPALDELITSLDIQVEPGSRFYGGYYHLTVPREVNVWALENKLGKTPGFSIITGWDEYEWGNPLRISEDAWIRPEARVGGWKLKVGIGWGDCPAGCIDARVYLVDVDASGATSVSASGDPLP